MFESFSSAISSCRNSCNDVLEDIFPSNKVNPFQGGSSQIVPCEFCGARFSIIKKRKLCNGCGLHYCSSCLLTSSGIGRQCRKCRILSHWPVDKMEISSLRVRDLRYYLNSCKIPTNTYKEKQELVDLVIAQLKHKHYISNQSNASDSRGNQRVRSDPVNVRDDGIRVSAYPSTTSNEFAHSNPESNVYFEQSEGIRVFPSTLPIEIVSSADEAQNLPSNSSRDNEVDSSLEGAVALPEPGVEVDESEKVSTDSSWSVIQLETVSNDATGTGPSEVMENVSSGEEITDSLNTSQSEAPVTNEQHAAPEEPESKPSPAQRVIVELNSLNTEDSLTQLSVRQCKELLMLHRVDFSGIREKHELLSKVRMLRDDYRLKIRDKAKLSEDQICRICMDAVMDCVFLECGHMVCCTFCGKQMAECPICRQNVVRIVRTFKA